MIAPTSFRETLRQWLDVFMHRSMSGWMQYVRASGLSMPQFSVLMRLHYQGECSISELSERMETSAAAASQLVDKLVQAGLLERTEDPNDRRAKRLALTAQAQALIARGMSERYHWVDDLAATLSPDEKEKIAAALEVMTERAQAMERAA